MWCTCVHVFTVGGKTDKENNNDKRPKKQTGFAHEKKTNATKRNYKCTHNERMHAVVAPIEFVSENGMFIKGHTAVIQDIVVVLKLIFMNNV